VQDTKAQILPIFPLTHGVVLPHMVVTIALESDESRAALAAARRAENLVLLIPRTETGFARVGTVAKLEDTGQLPSGLEACVVRGLYRGVVQTGVPGTGEATWVAIEAVSDEDSGSDRAEELAREYRATAEAMLESQGRSEIAELLRSMRGEPGAIADMAGYSPDLSFEQKIELLETTAVEERLEKVLSWTQDLLAEATLKDKIRSEAAEQMGKTQREYLLRQQLEAIRKELGEDEDEDVVAEYRAKLEDAGMSGDVRKEAERELKRLERTPPQNPEHGWIRTYLDWMVEMPWDARSDDNFNIPEARRILDEDHTGLADVKDRLIEFLAVRKLRAERGLGTPTGRGSGVVLTLVGPPGVGKTSLGESIARALGRKFVRASLGGVHDEAEIRGHRRTYIGALPGRIARALKEAGTKNPVFMLDEVDKVGADWRGDPSSALLEVLDPAQNHSFRDHYLDVELDLSEVLFVCTANVIETIPQPLLDRMELISLDGYTEYEKVAIARDHLLPRQLERAGLRVEEAHFTEAGLRSIIRHYTREAGVRGLERQIGSVLRKIASQISAEDSGAPVVVDEDDVQSYLGKRRFHFEAAERTSVPGVATGLAVTAAGGDVLFVEAGAIEGEPGLTLTGQLGDVMKESAQIALSFLRSHSEELGLSADRLNKRFHIHVPAGAVPKDGPSAGVAIVSALMSLAVGRPVRSTVGMTGEVTLQGRVLPIGGVKQKVLAAHRAGLREVVLPARNEPDLDDLPAEIRGEMTVHLVDDVPSALEHVLEVGTEARAA
jgi:ATP-dependent Lon protease